MTAPKRCVLYARLSISKEESVSIARQLESARKYAEGRGWEVVGEFVDDGVSATSNRPEDRKGWSALLAASDFEAVVVWKIDRLARRVLDFLHVDEVLRGRGAGLVAVEDPIDMTTPMGRAFATILAVFGEMEAAAIASRVRAARAHMIAEGRWAGGGVPYGYMAVDNPDGPGRVLTIDPERIDWLRAIVHMARNGSTIGAITSRLDEEGAPLPAGRVRKDGDRATWNRQTIEGLLRNPILAGMTPRNPGRERSVNKVDPFAVVRDKEGAPVINDALAIMSLGEFEELITYLAERPTGKARTRSDRRSTSPLLSRVAVCDDCEALMCRGSNQGKPTLYCPRCRQTIGRTHLDPHLGDRLLAERGHLPYRDATVADYWNLTAFDALQQRDVLVSQVEELRIRRGVVGRQFDKDRVLLTWMPSPEMAAAG